MRRVMMPTLEKEGSRGGINRYLEAIALTFPLAKILRLQNTKYRTIFSAFSKEPDALYFVHEVLPVGTAAWLMRKKYVIFFHGMDFDLATRNVWKRWLTRRILKGAEAAVVNSEALKADVGAFMGAWRATPVRVIYPPVSDELVEASKGTRKGSGWTDLRDLAKLAAGAMGMPIVTNQIPRSAKDDGVVRLLTVSRLVERKGHLKVLEAMAKLPKTAYTIVGSGPMKDKITAKIAELGLGDRVTFIPDADDTTLPDIYAAADIFVMPTSQSVSEREGFGIVYLEANLFGLPTVGTRTGGVAEAIIDGDTGLLIDDDQGELEQALKRLIDNPNLRLKLGGRGRERVLQKFTREEQMGKLERIKEDNKGL